MNKEISKYIEEIQSEIIAFRRKVHEYPELSLKEYQTTQSIIDALSAHGIEAKPISDNIGVTALIKGGFPGKTIALRADIDALPIKEMTTLPFKSKNEGIMHACGHDIHTSVLLGTALVLNQIKDQLHGSVRLIFQPGEEGLGGAKVVIKSGILETPKVSCIAAMHTWPFIEAGKMGLKSGPMMAASDHVDIKVIGQSGHAAHPHKSIDPVVIMSSIIMNLQTLISRNTAPIDSAVLTFGKIEGGTARNIIPDEVTCQGTCRTLSKEVSEMMAERVTQMAMRTAEGFGGSCQVNYTSQCPPVINDNELYQTAYIGLKKYLGENRIEPLDSPSMGSEDLAFYFEKMPGILMRLGTANENPDSQRGLHNAGIIFDDEKSIPTGITAFVAFATELLQAEY